MGIHFNLSVGSLAFVIVIDVFSFAFAYKVVILARSLSFYTCPSCITVSFISRPG